MFPRNTASVRCSRWLFVASALMLDLLFQAKLLSEVANSGSVREAAWSPPIRHRPKPPPPRPPRPPPPPPPPGGRYDPYGEEAPERAHAQACRRSEASGGCGGSVPCGPDQGRTARAGRRGGRLLFWADHAVRAEAAPIRMSTYKLGLMCECCSGRRSDGSRRWGAQCRYANATGEASSIEAARSGEPIYLHGRLDHGPRIR